MQAGIQKNHGENVKVCENQLNYIPFWDKIYKISFFLNGETA